MLLWLGNPGRLEKLRYGEWYAVVAGKPGEIGEAEVEQYREKLREPERLITHLGHIPDEDVAKYFAVADVVILPYRRAFKGTSGILQRAAAAGKPVIATDVGEVGPTVHEYGLGVVVEPESPKALAEGIEEFLVRKDELGEVIRPRALQYAKANDWRIMAKRVREAYLSSLEG
jgi:glycosyltransferase involved in cell wall biosynthesis